MCTIDSTATAKNMEQRVIINKQMVGKMQVKMTDTTSHVIMSVMKNPRNNVGKDVVKRNPLCISC